MTGLGQAGTAVWLDVTRLITRIGRGALTGIDRVERAYLRHVLTLPQDRARFLCRTTRGYLLFDGRGGRHLLGLVEGTETLGSADLLSRLTGRGARPRHRVEGGLRPFAIDRCLPGGLPRMVERQAQDGKRITYFNVGHANLSVRTLSAFARHRVAVLLHDLIPVLHPDTVKPGLPERFAARVGTIRRFADLVICPSHAAARDAGAHWQDEDTRPAIMVAPLGLDPLPGIVRNTQNNARSYVMLGTIEARKNHALILDAWDILAKEMPKQEVPHLHIIGARGWRVDDTLHRLATHPLRDIAIFEHGPLSEADTRAHLAAADALLFPSLTEGYGFPPLEALHLGVLPIVSDLAVLRETLASRAVYLPPDRAYPWAATIKKHLDGSLQAPDLAGFTPPLWTDHFDLVGRALSSKRVKVRS